MKEYPPHIEIALNAKPGWRLVIYTGAGTIDGKVKKVSVLRHIIEETLTYREYLVVAFADGHFAVEDSNVVAVQVFRP